MINKIALKQKNSHPVPDFCVQFMRTKDKVVKMSEKVAFEQKKFMEKARDQLLYKKIIESSTDGFIVVDKDGYIIDINKAYCEFLSIKAKEDVLGKYILDVITNSKLPDFLKSEKIDVDVLHKFEITNAGVKGQTVAVTRTAVQDDAGKVIAAFGQVKFAKETQLLAKKLRNADDELKYYKNELKRFITNQWNMQAMIGKSERFAATKSMAERAANNDFSVLITGETGTGKEVFATAIHNASSRKMKPFIRINCAAIPAELLESELFGYEEGAFTGASKGGKIGKFEMANGGTIFLDEIGDMPMNMQAKLLRALQEKEIEKVGGQKTIPIDVRIIAATNQNLEEQIKQKKFRSDLYYRLNVIQIKIPSLRERKEDIPLFIDSFLQELYKQYGVYKQVTPETEKMLQEYSWPGNIRELKNTIQRAYAMVDGEQILKKHLPAGIISKIKVHSDIHQSKSLDHIMEDVERAIIKEVLEKNQNKCCAAAAELGIHRSALYKKIKKLDIDISKEK